MALTIEADALPLKNDPHDVVRVSGTRVTLQSVIHAFQDGASPEEIIDRYPVLPLADVYATIAYYLRHRADVDAYLAEEAAAAAAMRREVEAFLGPSPLRERLAAARSSRG